jgi:hypothetical protein
MDEDTLSLILKRMDENHNDLKEVKESISDLKAGIVGQVHCDAYRRDFAAKLYEHTEQIRELKTVCDGYQATKTILISETELRDAKDEAINQSNGKYEVLEQRVKALEHYIEVFGFVWGNPLVKTFIVGSLLTLVGVYWGRIGQYGWHLVGAFLGAVSIVLVMSWISRRKNREATKATTKKIFGLKLLLVVLLVLSSVAAADGPPTVAEIGPPRPVVFPPEHVEKACILLDSWMGELLCACDHDRFLSDTYWPGNLSQNVTG